MISWPAWWYTVDEKKQQNGTGSIRSVERAFDILEALERNRQPVRLTDLARLTGMPKATVQRLLGVLERRGFADRVVGRFQIGVGVLPLSHVFLMENSLAKSALPVLQELARASQKTATLYVLHGMERVVVQRVEGKKALRYTLPIGQRLPLLLGAAGYVLAAAMSREEQEQLLDYTGDVRLCTGEVLSRRALRAKLDAVRRQGYAVSRNMRVLGNFSLAAPVVRPDGATVAAVAVTGLASQVGEGEEEALSIEVRQAAHALGERERAASLIESPPGTPRRPTRSPQVFAGRQKGGTP